MILLNMANNFGLLFVIILQCPTDVILLSFLAIYNIFMALLAISVEVTIGHGQSTFWGQCIA